MDKLLTELAKSAIYGGLYLEQRLQHLVGRGEHLGIRLVGVLDDDELAEFVGDIDRRASSEEDWMSPAAPVPA